MEEQEGQIKKYNGKTFKSRQEGLQGKTVDFGKIHDFLALLNIQISNNQSSSWTIQSSLIIPRFWTSISINKKPLGTTLLNQVFKLVNF